MPLNLDTPVVVSQTIDAYEIDSFSVDLARQEIVIGYASMAGAAAVKQDVIVLSGLDFSGAIARASELANAMPAGQVNVYGALKGALYEYMTKLVAGAAGTVA